MRAKAFVVYGKDYYNYGYCGSGCSVKVVGVWSDELEVRAALRLVEKSDKSYEYDYEEVDIEIPESQIKLWASELSECS